MKQRDRPINGILPGFKLPVLLLRNMREKFRRNKSPGLIKCIRFITELMQDAGISTQQNTPVLPLMLNTIIQHPWLTMHTVTQQSRDSFLLFFR